MNTQLLKDLKGILFEAGTFTVLVNNSMLGSSKYVGTFDSKEEAEDYANKEASRSRKFASFEVWSGTPKKPIKAIGDVVKGSAGGSSKTEELDESGSQDVIMQHIALAAQVAGVDLEDDASLKNFMAQVRDVVTKDKAQLKAKLKRWTSGKARAATRAIKGAI